MSTRMRVRKSETLLVVDDVASTVEAIQRNLTAQGYSVLTAPGVSEAMRILETASIDLVYYPGSNDQWDSHNKRAVGTLVQATTHWVSITLLNRRASVTLRMANRYDWDGTENQVPQVEGQVDR